MQCHCVVPNAVTAVFATFYSLRQMVNNTGSVPELGCFDFCTLTLLATVLPNLIIRRSDRRISAHVTNFYNELESPT